MRDTTPSRRNPRKLTAEEEIELRRARGELSCAECKRLKLKCDRNVPCSSCVRRGCPTLCPHGSLTNGRGSRFILTDTDGLHLKISEMSQRIRQLEDALGLLQSSLSSEKHPLLRDELLSIKHDPEQRLSAESETPEDPLAEPVEAFGTLTMGDAGESRYFGASAGSETLLSAETEPEDRSSSKHAIPELLNNLAVIFPVGSQCPIGLKTFETAMSMLLSCLPDRPRAWSLCENFLEQASWLSQPVRREELIHDIMNPVYAAKEEHEKTPESQLTVSPHKISILYSIFGLGSLADLTLPAFNGEGECYHHCARAALALRSMFDSPMVETVQAILFMTYYCSNSAQRYNRDSIWRLASLGSKVAQSIGMHRDPARWNIEGPMAERRRTLFWEIYSFDVLNSLALGRPPSIELIYVDCALPQAQQDESDAEYQFWNWKYQFTRNIYGSVLELTLGAKPADYKAILEVDRRIRETPIPPALDYFIARDHDDVSINVCMKGSWLSMVRPITMLYLHKNFFARALIDHPADPLASPYAASFLAATRSASSLIRSTASHINRDLCVRWLYLWVHMFSAAMIVGSVVTRAPSSSMAPAAFTELVLAIELFENGAKFSQRIRIGRDILCRLREKASVLLARYGNGAELPAAIPAIYGQGQDDDSDALAIFSGQARGLINTQRFPNTIGQADSPPRPPASIAVTSLIADPTVETTLPSATSDMGVPETHLLLEEQIFISGSTAYRDLDGFPEFQNQSAATTVSDPLTSSLEMPMPDFSSFHAPAGLTPEHLQSLDSSAEVLFDPTSTDPFQQLYAETLGTDTWGMEGIEPGQLGSESTGSGIADDWMAFMKESGLA